MPALRERRKSSFDFGAVRLEARRQAEARAERLDRFVKREARLVGGDFEEHTTGLAVVDRFEIGAVDDRTDAEPARFNLRVRVALRGIVSHAKRDMMDGAGAVEAVGHVRISEDVHVGAGLARIDGIAGAPPRLRDGTIAHRPW